MIWWVICENRLRIGFRNAFFSLNTWLKTIYCLQTVHEPACSILTLFQFLSAVHGPRCYCKSKTHIYQSGSLNRLNCFLSQCKEVSWALMYINETGCYHIQTLQWFIRFSVFVEFAEFLSIYQKPYSIYCCFYFWTNDIWSQA